MVPDICSCVDGPGGRSCSYFLLKDRPSSGGKGRIALVTWPCDPSGNGSYGSDRTGPLSDELIKRPKDQTQLRANRDALDAFVVKVARDHHHKMGRTAGEIKSWTLARAHSMGYLRDDLPPEVGLPGEATNGFVGGGF